MKNLGAGYVKHGVANFRAVPGSGLRIESCAATRICGVEILMKLKAKVMLGTVMLLLGMAFAMTAPADGPDPICPPPGRPCAAK